MLSFVLSILPILWLIVALCVLKMPGWIACGIAALLSAVVGIGYFHMGMVNALTAALEGVLNALWPICMVIVSALFVYQLTLKTRAMETIKKMLSSVSSDRLIIAIIIGWGFGNFMEGMAGFGTAVAIPAGILVAMGYDPIKTVVACLVINSTPTAFGSVGVPTSTQASVTGLNATAMSGDIALIQFALTFIAPFVMVCIMEGSLKVLKRMWAFCLVASLSFILPQFVTAMFVGPELPNILGSVVCMGVTVAVAIAMEKKKGGSFNLDITVGEALRAWSPFILIFVILLATSSLVPFIHDPIASVSSTITVYTGNDPGSLSFAWFDCPGVKIIIAGIIGGLIQGAVFSEIIGVLVKTIIANVKTIFTICSVLATAKIMGYSGMISAIAALLVAVTGQFYPLISPLIGMIGGFVTGSGTSTSVLFGSLQQHTAQAIGMDELWLTAANLMGGGIGKMISPQGIAIGCAASGLAGKESTVLNKTIPYAIVYIIIGGIICFVFA